MRDYGVKTVLTSTDEIPLFYDEHAVVDRPFTLAAGEVVTRGDLAYFESEGADYGEFVAADANAGDGAAAVDASGINESQITDRTLTITYDGATWDTTDQDGAVVASNGDGAGFFAGGLQIIVTAGATPFEAGDAFTIETYRTGSPYAYKASQIGHIAVGNARGVLIVARDTDATDGPEPTFGYAAGVFNQNAIGNWATIVADAGAYDDVIAELATIGIHVKEGLK